VAAPAREGMDVVAIEASPGGGFTLWTSSGDLRAREVVLSTGAYQRAHRPAGADTLPADLLQIDVEGYTNPDALPSGRVLVVGSGQSGCQIAEELHQAGREVVLSCGRAPWGPFQLGGRALAWWALHGGFFDQAVEALPTPAARLFANVQAGDHDLHYRTLRAMGVTLAGHFVGADSRSVRFAPDLAGLGAVVFAGGFRPDYRSWLPWPEAFDDMGFPLHRDGASNVVPGLSFVGVHFLRKRKSSLFLGVGEDAEIVARGIADRLGA
jgi:putative flavoprotein involved in K+ transport